VVVGLWDHSWYDSLMMVNLCSVRGRPYALVNTSFSVELLINNWNCCHQMSYFWGYDAPNSISHAIFHVREDGMGGERGRHQVFGDLTEACVVSAMLASGQVFFASGNYFGQQSCVVERCSNLLLLLLLLWQLFLSFVIISFIIIICSLLRIVSVKNLYVYNVSCHPELFH